jgi:fructose-1,6-bisphosphatase/sedoheptulose 1,7-bisphosphatase-like protein
MIDDGNVMSEVAVTARQYNGTMCNRLVGIGRCDELLLPVVVVVVVGAAMSKPLPRSTCMGCNDVTNHSNARSEVWMRPTT